MSGIKYVTGDATHVGLINDCPCLLQGKAMCGLRHCYHQTGRNVAEDFCRPCGNWGILAHAKVIDDKAPHKCQPGCPGQITRRRLELLSKLVKEFFAGAAVARIGALLTQARELEPPPPPRRKKAKNNVRSFNSFQRR